MMGVTRDGIIVVTMLDDDGRNGQFGEGRMIITEIRREMMHIMMVA
jgi:hypothetical protein